MAGAAKRGAVKFCAVGAVGVFYLVCVLAGDHTPYKLFLWTVAAGVCIKLLWPTQDEGEALIRGE